MSVPDWQTRSALLLGEEGVHRISSAHVLVIGLGGVGGVAAEMLCRAGIGEMTIADGDVVEASNRNRQIIATVHTVGMAKAEVMRDRLLSINPDLKLHVVNAFLKEESLQDLLSAAPYDCVLDAIDSLAPKVHLIAGCQMRGLNLVSSMGSGARLDPESVRCVNLEKTFNCSLARAVRQRLHRMGIKKSTCRAVFSSELPIGSAVLDPGEMSRNKRAVLGTISYMPAIFGCHCASAVLRTIQNSQKEENHV